MPTPLLLACGLRAEAKIAASAFAEVIAGGGDGVALDAALRAASQARALVSFGIAGGLASDLKPGAILVASAIVAPDGRVYPTHPAWAAALAQRLGGARCVRFAGVDVPLADIAGKRALHLKTGAALVDMESHIVARVAADRGLPLAAIRVVADPASRQLPHAATVGMRPDGRVDVMAVLRSLARNPAQIPDLIRTAREARAALAGLFRGRELLGDRYALEGLGLVDFGDPLLDMA